MHWKATCGLLFGVRVATGGSICISKSNYSINSINSKIYGYK